MHIGRVNATELEIVIARAVMLVMAVGIVFTGYTLITRPLAIPVAVGLWLGAAAIAFLGLWGKLPEAPDSGGDGSRP